MLVKARWGNAYYETYVDTGGKSSSLPKENECDVRSRRREDIVERTETVLAFIECRTRVPSGDRCGSEEKFQRKPRKRPKKRWGDENRLPSSQK